MAASIPEGMLKDFSSLYESILINIDVGQFHVNLTFLGDSKVKIRINKKFNFSNECGVHGFYDPTLEVHDQEQENASFIFLQGLKCRKCTINSDHMLINLGIVSSIEMKFEEGDFEPIECIGLVGKRFSTAQFHYVL